MQSNHHVLGDFGSSGASSPDAPRTRVFTSYSHADTRHKNALQPFLDGLERRRNFAFWSDERIATGDAWDERIRAEIARCHIALVLVSQDYLNSPYCRKIEVATFLQRRKQDGLVVYPVILSPCGWREEPWLSSTQFQPRGPQTVEEHFTRPGTRKRLFVTICEELTAIGEGLHAER
jgi:TIR domain